MSGPYAHVLPKLKNLPFTSAISTRMALPSIRINHILTDRYSIASKYITFKPATYFACVLVN